jgi:predicted dienelactone hydrolase
MSDFHAGCRETELTDEQTGDKIPLLVFYPTREIETPRSFNLYALEAAWDAPIEPGRYPLAVISHGSGGSPLTLRTLAQFLARNGWLVLAPEHPRNNRNQNDLAGTAQILENRPRHLNIVLDWAFAEFAASLTGGVAVIGHSLGGYTALAIAGSRSRSHSSQRIESSEPFR